MKIKNELVSIKIGSKQYDFKNLILDEYLKRFVRAQIKYANIEAGANLTEESATEYENKTDLLMRYCLIKFDEPLKNIESTELKNNDFDLVSFDDFAVSQDISEKGVVIQYLYNLKETYNYKTLKYENINKYSGRKITAIGFNSTMYSSDNCSVCAILDTSNYNIYIQGNQSFSVTRRDKIQSDALFNCSFEKYKGPIHLAPLKESYNVYGEDGEDGGSTARDWNTRKAFLYSVGLSSYIDYIDKERIIGEDIQIEINGTELIIKELENYYSNKIFFPNNDIYPGSNIYPIKSNYKYIIFKYKIYEYPSSVDMYGDWIPYTDTGNYYYQIISIDKFGKSNIKIKYERG